MKNNIVGITIKNIIKGIMLFSLLGIFGSAIYISITCSMLIPLNTCSNGFLIYKIVKICVFIFTMSLIPWLVLESYYSQLQTSVKEK